MAQTHFSLLELYSSVDSLGLSFISIGIIFFLALIFSSYVKIVTVLGILRVGIGVGSLPSIFVTTGLALVLSFFVMFPTLQESLEQINGVSRLAKIDSKGVEMALVKWKQFLKKHVHKEETNRFSELSLKFDKSYKQNKNEEPLVASDYILAAKDSWRVLAPAFLVSELKEAFQTGLSIFLPFLVIDLLVANILVAVGLTYLNPAIVSFPFKLLLFVMVDGWLLITTNLVSTYL